MKWYFKYTFLLGAFILLTLEFNDNTLRTVEPGIFSWFQKDSESLSVGRIFRSELDGPFSFGGFMGWNHPYDPYLAKDSTPPLLRFSGWGYEVKDHPNKFWYQYDAFEHDYQVQYFERYYSQTGVQCFIYYAIGYVFNITGQQLINYCRLLNAVLTAIMMTIFLWWAQANFGFFPAFCSLLTMLVSQWLILFANNMLYVTGLFFLPFIANLVYMQIRQVHLLKHILILTFTTVFLKCYIAGFDFIIPTLLMAILPIIMHAFVARWPWKKSVQFILFPSLLAGMGLMAGLLMLIAQLSVYHGSFATAMDYVINTSERRAYGNHQDLIGVFQTSMDVSQAEIISTYLAGLVVDLRHLFGAGKSGGGSITFNAFFVVFEVAAVLVLFIRNSRPAKGLLLGLLFSLIGPFGWFIIFKFHAISHTHMNFVIWHMPVMLLGPVLAGYVIKHFFGALTNRLGFSMAGSASVYP